MLAALDTTSTNAPSLGGINVCRATRISSSFGDSVTVNSSFATTELVDLIFQSPPRADEDKSQVAETDSLCIKTLLRT